MHRLIPILLLLVCLAGCTYQIPRQYLPYPLSNDSFDDPVKTVGIPLPVIASSPNEGITIGALDAFLLHNSRDEVSTLIVPQMNYNQYFGVTTTLYGAFYPSPNQNMKVNLSKATTINEEFRFRYFNDRFIWDRVEASINAFIFADGSARFFGFQSNSTKQNETNYTDRERGVALTLGYWITPRFEVEIGERYKKVNIEEGAVKSVPFITQRFLPSSVPGVDGYSAHGQRLSLIYNSLDSKTMPTSGAYARASIELDSKLLGSSASFRNYGVETRRYYSLGGGRFVSVIRFAANQTEGSAVPFLEQSILGGENTLRGYGQNRFIDKSYLLLNLEERIRVFRWRVFNVDADWELAPFVDLGSVQRSLVEAKASSFEFNPGVGLRAVVRPNIVGRIDVGFGSEGPAVFVGLNYPF
jgi:outer membrane protein assembly factor BamA